MFNSLSKLNLSLCMLALKFLDAYLRRVDLMNLTYGIDLDLSLACYGLCLMPEWPLDSLLNILHAYLFICMLLIPCRHLILILLL